VSPDDDAAIAAAHRSGAKDFPVGWTEKPDHLTVGPTDRLAFSVRPCTVGTTAEQRVATMYDTVGKPAGATASLRSRATGAASAAPSPALALPALVCRARRSG
jgi:hypothetical protein